MSNPTQRDEIERLEDELRAAEQALTDRQATRLLDDTRQDLGRRIQELRAAIAQARALNKPKEKPNE